MADVQVTCITKSSSNGGHEHITHLGAKSGQWKWTREEVIVSIDNKFNTFYVMNAAGQRAEVGVVRSTGQAAYVRTHADGVWTDNLLSLPSCP
jgi:hypothetical protein